MLNEREVALVKAVLLGLVARVQRNLLAEVDDARVQKPELALQPRLVRHVLAERRRQCAHHVCGELHDQAHEEEAFAADAARE